MQQIFALTSYCNNSDEDDCCNQYTKIEDIQDGVEVDNVAEESDCLKYSPTDASYNYERYC